MAKQLGLEALVIIHYIANIVFDVAFVTHDFANILSGYLPFLFPNLTVTESQQLLNDL